MQPEYHKIKTWLPSGVKSRWGSRYDNATTENL